MIISYTIIFYLLLPFIILRLLWKSRKAPEYRQRWGERFGTYNTTPLERCIWVHAVSLGETIAATPLIKALQQRYSDTKIVVTNMTPTGSAQARKTFKDSIINVYIPYDYPAAINRFIRHFNPQIAIIMETELWPNLFYCCHSHNIPLLLANARLSPSSYRGYLFIKKYIRNILNYTTKIAAQSVLDSDRFRSLGADADKVTVTGNLKFDLTIPKQIFTAAKELRNNWGEQRPVWIAASTHPGEDEKVLHALKIIKQDLPNILLILVPRHPERFTEVTKLCKNEGFNTITYSSNRPCTDATEIVVGDVLGKMLLFYAAVDLAFVGGSLVPIGGHNLLEPATTNTPIISGPHLSNFMEISELLTAAQGLIIVNTPEALAATIVKLFTDSELRAKMRVQGAKVVMENRGALNKLLELIHDLKITTISGHRPIS